LLSGHRGKEEAPFEAARLADAPQRAHIPSRRQGHAPVSFALERLGEDGSLRAAQVGQEGVEDGVFDV
jgi:hypothetical protein